jgi:hypothetical protein
MYKNQKIKCVLQVLVVLLIILCSSLIFVKNKFITYKNQSIPKTLRSESVRSVRKYGYSDILECIQKNRDFKIQSINVVENGICNVQANYNGDIKLLYSALCYLKESENFLSVNKISINRKSKTTSLSINFKKN